MILIQDASFKQPKGINWQKKYVQLDFTTSIKELEKIIKELKEWQDDFDFVGVNKQQQWCLTAFMKKCDCEYCKVGWDAHEKALKEAGK